MAHQAWSWILAAVGITGLWLAGSGRRAGWAIGIASQALWLAYAVATSQWGFLASVAGYGAVHVRNWRRWRATEHAPPAP
ncbi:hypothetical protein GCM10010124_26400 [Pilimelia terevasa]|uniref:Nicotinate ribosyltransferase n=1 Tax=Pilimelia terevasa TaxID=53372 RepID=A0A8J3BRU0_9ACTN|nr:hypothetical protein [Pilimelia terevasa]GGK32331.1 hypothetical protein GCM10010124_26400 [Pilimelia terevasa]